MQTPPKQMRANVGKLLHAFRPLFLPIVMQDELGTFLPLLIMHESSLQMQAYASQIDKEHYNMLEMRHRTSKTTTYSVQASPTR
jgi:hypothetical protein